MMNIYHYRSPFRSAEYRLTQNGISITSRKFGRFTQTSVPYDKIPIHSSTLTWSSKPLLWTAIILAIFCLVVIVDYFVGSKPEPLAILLYGSLCLLFLTVFFLTRTCSEVFMHEESHLSIFRHLKYDQNLNEFIESMQNRKFDFFKDRVHRRSAHLPKEEIERYLIYLREVDLVDEETYTKLLAYNDGLFSKSPGFVGFGK